MSGLKKPLLLFGRRILGLFLSMHERQASSYLSALEQGYYDALIDEDILLYGNKDLHEEIRGLLSEWDAYGVPWRVELYRRLWVLALRQPSPRSSQ